jgi:hypothetical protein
LAAVRKFTIVLLHGHRGSPAESGIALCYIAVAVCDLAVPKIKDKERKEKKINFQGDYFN